MRLEATAITRKTREETPLNVTVIGIHIIREQWGGGPVIQIMNPGFSLVLTKGSEAQKKDVWGGRVPWGAWDKCLETMYNKTLPGFDEADFADTHYSPQQEYLGVTWAT